MIKESGNRKLSMKKQRNRKEEYSIDSTIMTNSQGKTTNSEIYKTSYQN
jgi:hypothetical protein